ncbi:MAG: ABC transporter ATP-binding protein [Candidatus Thorarchaeota archaeon]
MTTAIMIQDVTKSFDTVTAVDNLSLEIGWGELFGLLGPNGAGKTTTVNLLSTLLKPTSGSVSVGGFDVETDPDEIKKLIGLCPQEPAYYRFLTGRENIELYGNFHGMLPEVLRERVDELVLKIGMEDHADRKAAEYSGGMIRRVSTAMALIHEPKIALLDEPTVAMDPVARRAIWDFIRELKSNGMAIILTTHYMEEAEELCDRVGIMDEGRLIALGTPKELLEEHEAEDLEAVFVKITGKKLRGVV